MAKITNQSGLDMDGSTLGTDHNLEVNTGTKKIRMMAYGSLVLADGVTFQALYSKLKAEWKSDNTLVPYPFPINAIHSEQFELINGWDFYDDNTRNFIRDGGWALVDEDTGFHYSRYMSLVTLGTFDETTHNAYYTQIENGATTDCTYPGPVNQPIQIYRNDDAQSDDNTSDASEYNRTTFLHVYLRERDGSGNGSTFSDYDLITEQSLSSLTYKKYALPLSTDEDAQITALDSAMGSGVYSGMTITWYASAQGRTLQGTSRDFSVIIDGNGGTMKEIYTWVKYRLRSTGDIDDSATEPARVGEICEELVTFDGSNFKTIQTEDGDGIYVDNYLASETNYYRFVDDSGTERQHDTTVGVDITVTDPDGAAIENGQVWVAKSTITKYKSHNTNNSAGDATFEVDGTPSPDADAPTSGWITVHGADEGTLMSYRYDSITGDSYALRSEVTNTTSSVGDSTILNKTGIGATDIVEGDTIRNTTDTPDAWAVVKSVTTNQVITSALQGGSSNTWGNGDTYSVHRLAITYDNNDTMVNPLMNEDTDSGGLASSAYIYSGDQTITIRVRKNDTGAKYLPSLTAGTITSNGFSATVALIADTIALT